MTAALAFACLLLAPVPAAKPAGPPPVLVVFPVSSEGTITVTATRPVMVTTTVTTQRIIQGQVVNVAEARQVPRPGAAAVELKDVKELTVRTAAGKPVELADALAAVRAGTPVVVSANGEPVDPKYLKLLRDDVLVFTSPELTFQEPLPGGVLARGYVPPTRATLVPGAPRPVLMPAPAVPLPVVPPAPPVIKD